MADTFVKKPVLLVGEKDEIVPQMGENDLGVATDVEFYTKQEVDDLVAQSGGAGRNIGDIFFTTRTDTSLNGAVEANGGQYNTTDFAGSDSVGNMLSAGNIPYVTIAQFDSTVANNGFCSLFGWDGGTVFKVPKIPSKIMTKDQLTVVGNGMTLGLTDGTNSVGLATDSQNNLTGALSGYGEAVGTSRSGASFSNSISIGVTTDPEKSGIIATVDTVELRPMVQLANGATDEAVVVAGNVLSDISGIKDGDGFTQTGKNAIVGWGMPDYSAGVQYTYTDENSAPSDGYFVVRASAFNNTQAEITLNGVAFRLQTSNNNTYSTQGTTWIPVSKGDVIKGTSGYVSSTSSLCTITFYPCKGVN